MLHSALSSAVVAEWLRRLTRNQFPSGSVGSNPTDCENFFVCVNYDIWKMLSATVSNSTFAIQHRWFSGRMLACHAGGPGSIPGRCKYFYFPIFDNASEKVFGGAGYRSRYLLHAKQALYHLSYAPNCESHKINPSPIQVRPSCLKDIFKQRLQTSNQNHTL